MLQRIALPAARDLSPIFSRYRSSHTTISHLLLNFPSDPSERLLRFGLTQLCLRNEAAGIIISVTIAPPDLIIINNTTEGEVPFGYSVIS